MKPDYFDQPTPDYEPVQGFVILLDALGTKAVTHSSIAHFMERRRLVTDILDDLMPWLASRRDVKLEGAAQNAPNYVTFGDTFLILWPLIQSNHREFIRQFQEMSSAMSYVVAIALIAGLPLRGAFSIGEFFSDSHIVIGPAVADAATWYEQPQMIGIMATPDTNTTLHEVGPFSLLRLDASPDDTELTRQLDNLHIELAKLFWPTFDLPVREGSRRAEMCLNWPYSVFLLGPEITAFNGEHVSSYLRRRLEGMPRPPSAQPKYDNTARFFDHCLQFTVEAESRNLSLALERQLHNDRDAEWVKAFLAKYG